MYPLPALLRAFRKTLPLLLLAALPATAGAQELVINEVLWSNQNGLRDETGGTPDWIELFNPLASDLRLDGYGLTDTAISPYRWVFTNTVLKAGQFLLVLADGRNVIPQPLTPTAPESLKGLAGWFRAGDIDTNDTTVVRRSGSTAYLKVWRDARANGVTLSQSGTGLQPVVLPANPLKGEPAMVRFDGVDDAVALASIPATNDFTLVVVIRNRASHEIDPQGQGGTGGTSGQRYLFGANHSGDVDGGMGLSAGTNGVSVYEHGSGYMPALAVMNADLGTNFQVISVVYSNKVPRIYWQGVLAVTGVASPRVHVFAPTTVGSGAYGAWPGDIQEIFVFNRALSETESLGVQATVASRHALPLRPSLHSNFSLSEGELVQVTRPDGSIADAVTLPGGFPSDISYGRKPDGGADWFSFQLPTPGRSNTTPETVEFLQAPGFSHPAGYHTNAFTLTLSVTNAGATLRYTLDGTEPTTNSPVFPVGGIRITNRATVPNKLSLIDTVPGGIGSPSGVVYKFAVVRARAFKPLGVPSPVVTRSFIVEPRGTNRFSLPVVSLVTDPANFFSADRGIYVPGNAPGGNYAQVGDDWERPAHVEFFEPDGSVGFSQGSGVRIHGNTSFYAPIKALRLHPLNPPGTGPIEYPVFPGVATRQFNRLLLRPSGQDYNLTMFRDVFMQSMGAELGLDTQAWRPVLLFIDGEYWGVHQCQEAFDPGYFASHHPGVDPDQIDYLEGFVTAVNGDTAAWDEMLAFINSHNLADPGVFTQLQTRMDTANFIDFKVCETYYYRWDIGNHRPWRSRIGDTRFRWILFDCDVGWGGFWAVPPAWAFPMLDYELEANGPWTQYEANPGGNDHNSPIVTFLQRALLVNPRFKSDFINRFADVMNTTFQSNAVLRRIDSIASRMAPEMKAHIDRWHAPATLLTWSNNVQYLRQFAIQRPAFMRQQLVSRFGLVTNRLVTFSVSDTNAGSIQVNTIQTSAPTNAPWTGVYFAGNPIQVTAVPRSGYRFDGWVGAPQGTPDTLALLLTNNLVLSARFVPLPFPEGLTPPPHPLLGAPYIFGFWPASSPARTYPPSMVFLQSTNPDPDLTASFDAPWVLSYDRTNRSRILGLGGDGIGFLDTGEVQADGGGFLGAALLALDTRGLSHVQVRFTAGTPVPNSRVFSLRLQWRVGSSGPFQDVQDAGGGIAEYQRNPVAGHWQVLGPVSLPAAAAGQPYIQLRWLYYHSSGTSGPRSELRLDDVVVGDQVDAAPLSFSGIQWSATGGISLTLSGPPLSMCSVETSTDLAHWTPLGTVSLGEGGGTLLRLESPTSPDPQRFYRLVTLTEHAP
jgi:hypothetical protein